MGRVVGIDLGSTFSAAAAVVGGYPKVIPSAEGTNLVPSVVGMGTTGDVLVGEPAKGQAIVNPENTIFSIKRLIGRKFRDSTVQDDIKLLPYKVTEDPNGDCRVAMGNKEYTPTEISAIICRKVKADAEAYLSGKVEEAVISVPACFNAVQRRATKEAGTMAGLNVLRMVNEPAAACLAYRFRKKNDGSVAIYDFGGGGFNIAIIDVSQDNFSVNSMSGQSHLGGDDFDQRIIDWLCDEFEHDQNMDLRQDKVALQRLKDAAERAKRELSGVAQTEISLPFAITGASGSRHLSMTLTRSKLEQLVMDLVEQTLEPCRQALKDAGLTAAQIDEVLLVGGQTRMPLVQEKVRQFFGKEPSKGVNPDEVVAMGAAIQAGILKGEVGEVLLLDRAPMTLGIETFGGKMTPLIVRNTVIPTGKSQIFTTAKDLQASVEIHVLQGDSPIAADNTSLGSFVFDGILPAPRGVPQIEITLDIEANGELQVEAVDKGTGKKVELQEAYFWGRESIAPHLLPIDPSQKGYQPSEIPLTGGLMNGLPGLRPKQRSSVGDMLDRQADRDLKEAAAELLKEKAKTERARRNRSLWSL
jgi:molecular chaperone DnaK